MKTTQMQIMRRDIVGLLYEILHNYRHFQGANRTIVDEIDHDNEGWIFVDILKRKSKESWSQNVDNLNQSYFPTFSKEDLRHLVSTLAHKGQHYLDNDSNIETRKKGHTIKNNPLPYIENNKSSKIKSGSAFRLRRNRETWSRLALYFGSRELLTEFLSSDYNIYHPHRHHFTSRFSDLFKILKNSETIENILSKDPAFKNRLSSGEQRAILYYKHFMRFLKDEKSCQNEIEELIQKTKDCNIDVQFMLDALLMRNVNSEREWFHQLRRAYDTVCISEVSRLLISAADELDKKYPGALQLLNSKYHELKTKNLSTESEEIFFRSPILDENKKQHGGSSKKKDPGKKPKRAKIPTGKDALAGSTTQAVSSPVLSPNPIGDYVDLVYIQSSSCEMEVWPKTALDD